MKKLLVLTLAVLACASMYAQKKIDFQQAQTRIIEPMQDVYVRPLAADLKIIKNERVKYPTKWLLQDKKMSDLTFDDLKEARMLAAYYATLGDDADVLVGATFEIRNHPDSEFGVDVTVRGYPAIYTNWHKMGDDVEDAKWFPQLIEGQRTRIVTSQADASKTEAVEGRNKK